MLHLSVVYYSELLQIMTKLDHLIVGFLNGVVLGDDDFDFFKLQLLVFPILQLLVDLLLPAFVVLV